MKSWQLFHLLAISCVHYKPHCGVVPLRPRSHLIGMNIHTYILSVRTVKNRMHGFKCRLTFKPDPKLDILANIYTWHHNLKVNSSLLLAE